MQIDKQLILESSQQFNEIKSTSKNTSFWNNFFHINKLYQEKNKITTCFILSFQFMLPIAILLKDLPADEETILNQYIDHATDKYFIPFYSVVIFNKFLIAGNVAALYRETYASSTLTTETLKFFRTKIRGLIQIDFHISMLAFSFSVAYSILNCVTSFFICLFACIFLQNYIVKQDLFYSSSSPVSFSFRILLTVGYVIVAFLYDNKTDESTLIVIISLYVFIMIFWYYRYGHRLYPNELPKRIIVGFISMLITTNLLIIQKHFEGRSSNLQIYFIKILLTFSVVLISSDSIIQRKQEEVFSKEIFLVENIKELLENLLINEHKVDKVAEICGRIQIHKQKCSNLSCELHNYNLNQQKILVNSECWGIGTLVKSFFRCLYEAYLKSFDNNKVLLEYLNYLFYEVNPNPFKMSIIISQIDQNYLDVFEKASFFELRRNVQRQFDVKREELYQGRLNFEQVLEFDECSQEIGTLISYLIKTNIKIYRHINNVQIDLNVVFQQIRSNLQIQKQLNKLWLKISKNIRYQKLVVKSYFYYKQLIKNQKITRKDLYLMNLEGTSSMKEEKINRKQRQILDSYSIFHKQTMVFTSSLLHGQLLFKDFNYSFEYHLKYTKVELKQSTIDVIFDAQLAKVHQKSFKTWMVNNTNPSFENAHFEFKKTECISKQRQIIPVSKYFKCYLNSNSDLEFVCMLKVTQPCMDGITLQMSYLEDSEIQSASNSFQVQKQIYPGISNKMTEFSNQNAIFIKQKQFQPTETSKDITNIRLVIILFFIFIGSTLIAFHIITVENASKLQEYSQQYITFMQCYRMPMILGINYLQSITGVGNQSKVTNQIITISNQFTGLLSNSSILKSIFDSSINTPVLYYPYINGSLSMNSTQIFDQMQLFYTISSSVASLRAPVNPSSQDFIAFDKFITPSYDDMMNNTKHKFHQSFVDYINKIISNELIIDVVQLFLAIILVVVLISKIKNFMLKMKIISDAIVQFKKKDLEIIWRYWKETHRIFVEIFKQYKLKYQRPQSMRRIQRINIAEKVENKQQYLNRINKIIIPTKHFQKFSKVSYFLVVLGVFIVNACLFGIELSKITSLSHLIYFQNEGYRFLKYFPTAAVVGYGTLLRHRSIQHPQIIFNSSRFDTTVGAMKLVGQFEYIPTVKDQDSLYFLKQRNYFFGNPCTFNPTVIKNIGVNASTCQAVLNGTFSRGLTSFMRDASTEAENYFNGNITLVPSQLQQFVLGVSILSAYVLDAISTWGIEFSQDLQDLISQQIIFTSINFTVAVTVFSLIYCYLLIGYLRQEYEFYRYMFLKMIPSYILKDDKMTRQTFINFNILQ